jgi:cytochrome c oxidase assembly factor CtaG
VHRPSPDPAAPPLDVHTALSAWSVEPALVVALAATALVYARGWRQLRRRRPEQATRGRLVAFLAGLGALFLALASPLDVLADRSLVVHMAQHVVLLVVVPPLLLLGAPIVPLLYGLGVGRLRRAGGALVRLADRLAHPLVCWLVMSLALWGWHVPAAFELALHSRAWHVVEHVSFLVAGTLFWWPVVQPWPYRPRWPEWAAIPYLLVADVQNTVLAALLVFSGRVLYPSYGSGARALDDQLTAGVLMWVPMSLVYLVPAAVCTVRWLSPGGRRAHRGGSRLAAAASSRKSTRRPARAASATGSLDAGDSRASRTAAALFAPNAATHTNAAPASAGSVNVSRRDGGFGESSMGSTVRVGSSSPGWSGKREHT